MSTRSWEELVELGRKALAKESGAQWALGDLVLELEPVKVGGGAPGARGNVSRGIYERIEAYARALGTSYRSLLEYRTVAHAWPKKDRDYSVCFGVHAKLAPAEGRMAILKRLVETATRENRPVSVDDALMARGKPARKGKLVEVSDYARSAPHKPPKALKTREARRQLLEPLSTAQIGQFIDEAWTILEERARHQKAA